jgi:hypothetical protein
LTLFGALCKNPHLGDIFTELLQDAAAGGTALFGRKMGTDFPRKMIGKRPSLPGRGGTIRGRRLRRWFRCNLGSAGFEFFELELELFDLSLDLLRAPSNSSGRRAGTGCGQG